MLVGGGRGAATAWRAHDQPLAHEVGLGHGLHCLWLLPHAHRQRGQPHRASPEAGAQGLQDGAVQAVQPEGIDLEDLQGGPRSLQVQVPGSAVDLGPVLDPAQQAVGDTRGTTRAASQLRTGLRLQLHAQQPGRAGQDPGELGGTVVLQMAGETEAVAQRRGKEAGSGRGAHDGEGRQ